MEATLIGPSGTTPLMPGTLGIGSAQDNQIIVVGDDISPYHAQLRQDTQGSNVVDLGSSAGTFVNGERLYPNVPRWLFSGDNVQIGNTRFTYQVSGLAGTPAPVAAPAIKSRKGPRPALIVGIVVLVLIIAAGAVLGVLYVNGSNPTKTVQAFCDAQKNHNAQAAYDQYGSGVHSNTTLNTVKTAQTVIADCTVKSVDNSSGNAVLAYTFSYIQGQQFLVDVKTDMENLFVWKIYYQVVRSTPTLVLNNYCVGLAAGNTTLAYQQLSKNLQGQFPADQFATAAQSFKGIGCSTISVDDNANTGTTTTQFSSGFTLTYDYKFVPEQGKIDQYTVTNSRIDSQNVEQNPSYTLFSYCNALGSGDYATAYALFDSNIQSQGSQNDFAASFTHKVTACQASNIDNTAGKGTITFTYDDNSTATQDFTLVNSNNAWLIDTIQQH